jgi:hypothetical protein
MAALLALWMPWAAGAGPEEATITTVPAVLTSSATFGEVEFPHGMHVDDLGLACADCHHETNATRLKMPHADYFDDFWIDCRICHLEEDEEVSRAPRSCATCHHEAPSNIADQTLSSKVVIHKSCWGCHELGTGREASRNCGFCHKGRKEKTP